MNDRMTGRLIVLPRDHARIMPVKPDAGRSKSIDDDIDAPRFGDDAVARVWLRVDESEVVVTRDVVGVHPLRIETEKTQHGAILGTTDDAAVTDGRIDAARFAQQILQSPGAGE